MNHNLVLIAGKTATGKSLSLRNIPEPKGVWYLNCENNKALPFRSKFRTFNITDPLQVYDAFERAEDYEDVHTIVIDTVTYLMDMFEGQYVIGTTNTQKAWGDYAQFFKKLMSDYVANSTKKIVFLGHTLDLITDEAIRETVVKVKGSLMDKGIESAFSCVVATKKLTLKELEGYDNKLLKITEDDEINGFKYVFQTRITKKTTNERIRHPLDMWTREETYIDNDINTYFERIAEYYADEDEE